MPHLPAITRVPRFAQLASELAHARVHVLLEDARRCEQLGLELLASERYSEDWLVAQLTGFGERKRKHLHAVQTRAMSAEHKGAAKQPENEADASVLGSDVLHDLGALCEQLCQQAIDAAKGDQEATAVLRAFSSEPCVSLAQLREELNVSPATMARLRRAGLVTRRVPGRNNIASVFVSAAQAQRVRKQVLGNRPDKAAGDGVQGAKGSTPAVSKRLSTHEKALYVRAALRFMKWARLSVHGSAHRIAAWTVRKGRPRSVEGVRGVLLRDARVQRLMPKNPARTQQRALAMLVLHRRGAEANELAKVAKRTPALARRDMALARRALLQAWLVQAEIVAGPVFQLPNAKDTLLAGVQTVTIAPPLEGGTQGVATLRSELPFPANRERELATAMHFLRWQVATSVPGIDHLHPSPHELDRCETQLRGAWLLRAALASSQRRRVLETMEARCGHAWEELVRRCPPAKLRHLVTVEMQALFEGVEGFDPFKGGRLAASCSLRIDRALARALREDEVLLSMFANDDESSASEANTQSSAPSTSTKRAPLKPALIKPARATKLSPADASRDVLAEALQMPRGPMRSDGALRLVLPPQRALLASHVQALEPQLQDVLKRRWCAPIAPGMHALPCTLRELGAQRGQDDIRTHALQQQALRALHA
jgi:hypothetical protein